MDMNRCHTPSRLDHERLARSPCHPECNEACPAPVEGGLSERPALSPSPPLRVVYPELVEGLRIDFAQRSQRVLRCTQNDMSEGSQEKVYECSVVRFSSSSVRPTNSAPKLPHESHRTLASLSSTTPHRPRSHRHSRSDYWPPRCRGLLGAWQTSKS